MFKEWKAIFKKPTFIIVMIGISLIPALYNIIFLSSMWDPYGQVSELPVAVVNKDKEAFYNGQTMRIGEDMVSNLKENKALDFHFVNEEEGEKGLEDGDYYMVVTLPSDLSEKAASILSDHPEQMTINYQTSSGHSFIASKMSDSAMTQLKQNVSANVTESYTKALFQKMGDLKSGLTKAADGSEQLANGASQLAVGSQTLSSNLATLASSSLTFSDGTDQFTKGLTTYVTGVKQLNSGLGTFNDGLQNYTSAVSQVDTGLNQLSSKTPELVAGVNQLNTGMKSYAGGVSQLNSGLSQFSVGVNAYTSGVDKLSVGTNQLSSQPDTLRDGITQLNKGIKEISTQLNTSSQQKEDITQLASSLDELNKSLQSVTVSDNTDLKNTISNDLTNITTLAQTIVTNSQAEQEKILTNLQATATYQSLTETQKKELTEAVSNNSNSTIESAKAILTTAGDLKENLGSINQPVSNLSTLQTKANQLLPIASSSLISMSSGFTQLQNAVDNQLVPGSQSIENGVNAYTKGLDTISLGVNQLSEKNTTLTTSLDQLVSASTKLTENSSKLTTGLDTLAGKTPELVTGIEKLSSGSAQLNNKSPELIAGLTKLQFGSDQLTDKSTQLLSAASQLGSGAMKIADGAGKLAEGGATLTAGIESLQVGTTNLGQGLRSASNQLKSASTESKNAETLSEPLVLSKTDNDQVPVNGIAMAPYMISVALFVAALSTNMIFAKLPSGRHPETRWAWFKSRFEINGVIAVLAAVLVYGGVHLIGLTANHEMRTLFLIIIASLTFMSMVTALTTWNSRIGAFFSLILLLLQLASSAGTYPLALTNDFFKGVNPWLPMSYSVSGLRQTISMTGNIHHQVIFLIITLAFFTALGMLAYQPKKMEED
ncbi:YhgE/Pip domain-containing protein [Streptococcus oralis]|uniref:ABC-2 type transporter transmembrane domain-containing protein n=2 Tax=Streptococcus TaxID=1301 RepID=A0A1L8Q489_STROR|nr:MULTISPECIES: YhgE/Pip domain-containing protein [Streptococcus]MCP9037809.1 YhgE/Pip domain-containing protein [Streptococcus oralis]MCP9053264.1 YhgE/Pip domain-containing protein [Streptococcus oralis]MCP9058296.1 YhgE/Pip domain-containing protein [Streptococcus oralis]MCP9065528.1 YhgE/Pip domain-containing protein [Streptococcus oralis]MCP9070090.1 YhgE/Pip domain-containing protein [Streptococcus oralis]